MCVQPKGFYFLIPLCHWEYTNIVSLVNLFYSILFYVLSILSYYLGILVNYLIFWEMEVGREMNDLVRIPSSVNVEFRRFVRAKYGDDFKKGHYMEEFGKAVLRYIRTEKVVSAHTPAHDSNLYPKSVLKLRDKVMGFLENTYNYDGLDNHTRVILKHLQEAISYARGTNERTITKGLEDLTHYKIIRECGTGGFEFAPFKEEHDETAKKELYDALRGYEPA